MPTDRLDAAAEDRSTDRSLTGTLTKHRPITHPASQAPTAGVPEPLRSAVGADRVAFACDWSQRDREIQSA